MVGPLGEHGADDGPDEPQKEHRQLVSLLVRVGAGVYSAWHGYKDSDGGMRFLVGTGAAT